MTAALTLRLVAVAIAVAGIADPVWSVSRRAPRALAITVLDTPTLQLPDGAVNRRQRALDAADRIQAAVADEFDTRIRMQSTTTDANPCPDGAACVLVSDGARPRRLSATGFVGAVRVGTPLRPNVAITQIKSNTRTHPNASGVVEVTLERTGVTESHTDLHVFDGDVLVGQGTNGRVEWAPIEAGVRELRVVASTAPDEITTLDNEARIVVDVSPRRDDVLVYEPQPTWSGTFVRRALEDDARFRIRARARVGGSIDVSTADAPLNSTALERSNTRVVLVTAADTLTPNEVGTLAQFMRVRGGSVVLLVDRPVSGPIGTLLPFAMTEHRENEPAQIGSLKAAEFLTFGPVDALTTVLASAPSGPAVVSRPFGNGRLVVSGVADAWRFRHENGAFAEFWQAIVADAAEAAGDVLTVSASKRLVQPGERVRVDVEWRPVTFAERRIDARASLVCAAEARKRGSATQAGGNASKPVRLWPAGVAGRFEGELVAPDPGDCQIDAVINEFTGSVPLLVRETPALFVTGEDEISGAVSAHGGTVVNAAEVNELITELRRSAAPHDISIQTHPLRSPWWIVPFACCLGGEWWLRRRKGRT
jgi:hypothetical protein